MKKKTWMGAGLGLGATLLCSEPLLASVTGPERNFGLDVKLTGQWEDDRDLGTRSGGDVGGVGIDLRPWVYGSRGDWSAFVMGQAVAATDTIETDPTDPTGDLNGVRDSGARDTDDSYLALREFWIDYAGLTPYPGEHLRLGRQRVRSDEGIWWDTYIEALNWTFDTTLVRAQAGAAERFSEYRTDLGDDLDPEDEDRSHFYGGLDYQWQPGHWAGLKLHHSRDDGDLPDSYQESIDDELSKEYTGDLTWLGLHLDGDYFNHRSRQPLNYWAQLTWLTGDIDRENFGPNNPNAPVLKQDVDAWAIDLGLRWNLNEQWKLGAAYARGSGGEGDDESEQFQQTGLHSNRSAFTGVQTRLHRFGEAFRGELTNTEVATLYTSWRPNQDYDASLVYHRFWRVDDNERVGDNGVNPSRTAAKEALKDGEDELGQEIDLVLTRYFHQGLLPIGRGGELDEQAALVRFRGGLFFAGNAYASKSDSVMHRAFVDFIWRF